MISYKQFIAEKFLLKKLIKKVLDELEHENYYIETNSKYRGKNAVRVQWYKESAPVQIFQFRDIFEERYSDKYILETKESNLKEPEYYIVERD